MSEQILAQSIQGTWKLSRFEIVNSDGQARRWGRNARGLLIYTEDMHMSVSINRDPQPAKSGELSIINSILFYAGIYTVHGSTIKHQVTLASNPERVGKELIRFAGFHEDEIHLTTPQESFGVANLVWKKIDCS